MAERTVTLRGNSMKLQGGELQPGDAAPDFRLIATDMKPVTLADTGAGVRIFSVVPSLDTPVCDQQTRRFNDEAGKLGDVKIYTVSRDLPFAQKRWCGAAGADKVVTLSDYRDGNFGRAWGVMIDDLLIHSRAVFIVGSDNKIKYAQYVPEVGEHPNYDAALEAARSA